MRSLARESHGCLSMIRITTHHEPARTVVTIEGRLTAADLPELRRVRGQCSGAVALDLGGLETCARDGIRLLQDWLDAGAQLDAATPFLRMVLQDRKDSSNQPP